MIRFLKKVFRLWRNKEDDNNLGGLPAIIASTMAFQKPQRYEDLW